MSGSGEGGYQPPSSDHSRALLGAEGQEYILTKLSSGDPKVAITTFQKQFSSLSSNAVSPSIPPILELTDLLNVQRNNLFFGLMNHLKKILLDKIENESELTQEKELLEQIFPYIGFEELRPIVYSLLKRMDEIPVNFLQQLQGNNEIFKNLPIEVKRQVWVNDENLFIKHISTLLKKYDLPQIYKIDLLSTYKIDPKKKREKNQTLTSMINILGKDPKLYHRVLGYCRSQLLATGSRHLCTFRYDLLMALHDNQVQQLHQMDMCHYFCWWLDAWIRTVHANLLNYVYSEHSEDAKTEITCTRNQASLSHASSSGSLGSSTGATKKAKPKKGSKAKAKPVVKKEETIEGINQQGENKQVDSSDTINLKDFFDVRRMKELRHFFDNIPSDSEAWGDIAVICRSPFISNTLLQEIFYLLELIYSQHPNMPVESVEQVLLSMPMLKQKNKRKATEPEESNASAKKKVKVKPQKEGTTLVNTNTKGTTIKISFKSSDQDQQMTDEAHVPTPVPTAPINVAESNSPVVPVNTAGILPTYLSFLEEVHNVHDFVEYIETLTRLYYAGDKAQAMLKIKIPYQLPPLPEFLAFEFYPFIQRLLFSTDASSSSKITIEMDALQEQLKKHSLERKLLIFSILRFHQNAKIAAFNSHRNISGYETPNDNEGIGKFATERKKDDDIEKFRNIEIPSDAHYYSQNLHKLNFVFRTLFLEGETTELSLFGKSVIQREFNFVDSFISDCCRVIKDIQQYAIPVLLSGNIKWFLTTQLAELVQTYSLLFEHFIIPYICFTKQESLSFQISVSTCIKDISYVSHLLGSILLTVPKEVFLMKEKKDNEDIDDENKKCIHSFDEYKESIMSLKNFCQTTLQQLKSVTLSDTQLTKIFQAIETQLAKEWKALQTESKSLLLLQQEQEALEKAKKEKKEAIPSTPTPFASTPKLGVGGPFTPSPFGKPLLAQFSSPNMKMQQTPPAATFASPTSQKGESTELPPPTKME